MATTAPKLTYVGLATISKVETTPDGNRLVYGKATDETLDGDKQIVDLKWAKGALADWLKTGGNLRVQHNPMLYPAGVGVELDATDQGHWLKSNVGEPTAIKLLDLGALSAYSVGIANPKVVRDASAPNGRIVGGQIVEVSLVDRPANPSCGIKIVKSADGGFAFDVITKSDDDDEGADLDDPDSDDAGDTGASGPDPSGDVSVSDTKDDDKEDAEDDVRNGKAAKAAVADDEAPKCKTCDGSGKIREGHVKCPDCKGSGDATSKAAKRNKPKKGDKPDAGAEPSHGEDVPTGDKPDSGETMDTDDDSATKSSDSREEAGSESEAGAGTKTATSGERPASDGSEESRTSQDVSIKISLDDNYETIAQKIADALKQERSPGGTFTTRSNAVSHDPAHHDDPRAETNTEVPAQPDTTAIDVAMGRAARVKTMAPERVAWMLGDAAVTKVLGVTTKSDVSTKDKRESAKFVLHGSDGEVKFPINDCSDVEDAWGLRGHGDIPKATVAAYIKRAAKSLSCPIPGADKQSKQSKQSKQAKSEAKKLRKQAAPTVAPQAEVTVLERYQTIAAENAALLAKAAKLEKKLEQVQGAPTLGDGAIRMAKTVQPTVTKVAVPSLRKAERKAERLAKRAFLENIASTGTVEESTAALDMIVKLDKAIAKRG
jgi:hypothetical protein